MFWETQVWTMLGDWRSEAAPLGSLMSPKSLQCGPLSFPELDFSFGKHVWSVFSMLGRGAQP